MNGSLRIWLWKYGQKLAGNGAEAGFAIPYMNYFRGSLIRYGGWHPDYHLRLFRKDKGRFEQREIHESPVLDGPVGKLRHPLKHLAYRDVSHFTRKMDDYSTLMARQYYKEGKKAGTSGPASFTPSTHFFPCLF